MLRFQGLVVQIQPRLQVFQNVREILLIVAKFMSRVQSADLTLNSLKF